MKNNYFRFLFFALTALSVNANAQCSTGCTTTISVADGAPHVITSGQLLCVTASGTLSGPIVVQSGGTLCNAGTITSDVYVTGGTLNNYGTINSGNIQVDMQGSFFNSANADIDSLLITTIYSSFTNSGTFTGIRFAVTDYANATNYGSITQDYMGDSLGQFTNSTSGSVTLNFDLYNAYSSGFFNYGFMSIGRDFLNSTGSTFETSCMISVGRDWYNSSPAIITGPGTGSCGGFNVAGLTLNNGTIGSSGQHVDICDAGSPPGGMDGPGGTIASTTTHCSCGNICVAVGIAEHTAVSNASIMNVYPNPAKENLSVVIADIRTEKITVEVMDMMGRKHSLKTVSTVAGMNNETIDVSDLASGTYILVITDSEKLQAKQLFTVVK